MECQGSNVKQKTAPSAQDEKEQGEQFNDPSGLPSAVAPVNGGECDDLTKSQKGTKKKRKKKKKKTGESGNTGGSVDIDSTSQSLPVEKKDENTSIPPDQCQDHMKGWNAKRSVEHESDPSTTVTVETLPGEYDGSQGEAANCLSLNKTADQIVLQTSTQSECSRDKVSTKIIGQQEDNTETPSEDVTTQESSGSQLEVPKFSLQGEGEYSGLNVKKKKKRKKKNKKSDMQKSSVTEGGVGGCSTTLPVENESSGSLDASNVTLKFKKDSGMVGIPALEEEPDKIVPGPEGTKEKVEDVPEMVKEDKMCPVKEGTEGFQDAEAVVRETTNSADGVSEEPDKIAPGPEVTKQMAEDVPEMVKEDKMCPVKQGTKGFQDAEAVFRRTTSSADGTMSLGPDGQQEDNTETPSEDVTTQASSGSQLEVPKFSLQGEGEYSGLNVKKKKKRKKKNKKSDMQKSSVTEGGVGGCSTTLPVENESSGSLDASNVTLKFKKDSGMVGIPALEEEPDKIVPGPEGTKEKVEDVPEMVKEDKMCPVKEGTEGFQDAEAVVRETTNSADGVLEEPDKIAPGPEVTKQMAEDVPEMVKEDKMCPVKQGTEGFQDAEAVFRRTTSSADGTMSLGPDGQQEDNTETPSEDVTTQASSGSQLEVPKFSLQGEGEYSGLNVKKKKKRKKKNKKSDMQKSSVTEGGVGGCSTTLPVENESSGSLDASNVTLKFKKDSGMVGIPALEEEPDKIVPGPEGTKEKVEDVPEMVKEDKMCPVKEGTEGFQDAEAVVRETTNSADGVSEEPDKIAPGPEVTKQMAEDVPEMVKEDKMCPVKQGTEGFQDAEAVFRRTTSSADGTMSLEPDGNASCDDIKSTSVMDETEDITSTIRNQEERNILCVLKLIYGVGLRGLRKLFMEINPLWTNSPSDAAGIDKGKMKLEKEDELCFNTGKIDKWDFSLMTTVLLFSKTCSLEIAKRSGHYLALKNLKVNRNKLLGHPSSERMSDADFDLYWPPLSSNFVTLGVDPDDITEIKLQSDEALHSGDYYRKLFLTENEKRNRVEAKLDVIDSKIDAVLASQSESVVPKAPLSPKSLSGPKWDEWLKFCDAVDDFQASQNQYILVSDALSPEDLGCFSRLRSVPWKMVLDFDPMSEEKGFYREFTSKEGQSNLVSMFTPAELERRTMSSLIRQIDAIKIQWLFVNGRNSDNSGKSQSFPDWEAQSVKEISRLFGCCSDPDKFDKQKPVVCLILPFCRETSSFLGVTLSRLVENFRGFNLRFVSFRHQYSHLIPRKFDVRSFDLSPHLVNLGFKEMFSTSTTKEYRMPTSHAGVPAKLSQNDYLYLKEHLEILYDGCEDLPEVSDDPADTQLKNFFDEQRRSFISGNQISFVSLYDNHDAKREIESEIRTHIQRVLDQGLTRSLIVEIRHSPGTGGTTIARRVMWDLHKAYPCAFIRVSSLHYFDEDNIISGHLVERILALEEICHTAPVILIDGKQSGIIESLSNKLVRMLCNTGKRALLLRCLHGSKPSSKTQESSHVHHVFQVNVKLENSIADLREFQSKYKEFLEQRSDLCRVFHFPLLAMMEEFRPKLKKIVDDSLNGMGGLQQEVAVTVAFLQKYANHETPALLLHEAFKSYIRMSEGQYASYEDISKQLFTETLLNLMVPTDPLRQRRMRGSLREPPPESYTLQHHLVADLVLKNVFRDYDRDLFSVVSQFLQFPIYQHEHFLSVFQELFAYNKYGQKLKFSILIEELKVIDSERAAEVFCVAAEKTNDPVIIANAARFLAKKDPPSFSQAKQLIHRAFQISHSKLRSRTLSHIKGVILSTELKHMIHSRKVQSLTKLEDLATDVLEAYHQARDFPPAYPHPLIGEVEVWLTCIEWIMKNICWRDSDETLKYITNLSPPFFRTCVSDSFYLLDIVDGIVQSVPNLTDPEETQRLCNNARLSLMSMFRKQYSKPGHRQDIKDVVQACKALCNANNFPKSSQLELKRLQAQFILSSTDQIDKLEQDNLRYLLRLLEELVLMENEYRLANHLMKICVLATGPRCYSLEQGLNITDRWLEVSQQDGLPYFYQMAIYFLKILDGNVLEVMPRYKTALKMCRDKSKNNLRSTQSTLFVGKEGQGMSRLITRNTLFLGETEYSTGDSEKVSKFWLVDSRKKLLECKGRIRMGKSHGRHGKSHPYIELVQGNVELYVGKNADIGKVGRDLTLGTLAYFVVSFNLQGPVANGISLSPQCPSHN